MYNDLIANYGIATRLLRHRYGPITITLRDDYDVATGECTIVLRAMYDNATGYVRSLYDRGSLLFALLRCRCGRTLSPSFQPTICELRGGSAGANALVSVGVP